MEPVPNKANDPKRSAESVQANVDALWDLGMSQHIPEAVDRARVAERAKWAKAGVYGPTYNAKPITDEDYIPYKELKKKRGK